MSTPVATIITLPASKIGEFIKSTNELTRLRTQIAGIAMRGLIYLAALIVPLGIWTIYLGITYAGLRINCTIGACYCG